MGEVSYENICKQRNQKIVSCSIRYLGSLPSVDTRVLMVVLSAVFFVPIACFRIGRRSDIGGGLFLFQKQNQVMEQAVSQLQAYLDGDHNARIECDEEGELYRLFHTVNSMAAVLNAHADNELREKEFLKNTISDISHQLKTPLAALNIYNGLLQDGDMELSAVKEFTDLSEQELDRIEILVQNLLKITKLDAGAIVLEKTTENVADMLRDVELHFAYRAKQEHKELVLSGPEEVLLFCDRDWLTEAIDNIVKTPSTIRRAATRFILHGKLCPMPFRSP